MDRMKDGNEVVLTQLVDVVVNDQLQTAEASGHHLLIIDQLGCLADGHDDEPPTLVAKLLPAGLDNLLDSFKGLKLV